MSGEFMSLWLVLNARQILRHLWQCSRLTTKHRQTKNPKVHINCHCDPGFGRQVEPKDCPDISGRLV